MLAVQAGCAASPGSNGEATAADPGVRGTSPAGSLLADAGGIAPLGDSGAALTSLVTDGAPAAGIPGAVAGPGTTIAGCEIFPADNAWNVAVDGPNVQVIHTYDAHLASSTNLHPDLGTYSSNAGGIPFNVVDAGQPLLDTEFVVSASESDPGPNGWIGTDPVTAGSPSGETAWPFFVDMQIEGNPPAGGTPGQLSQDQHGIVLQQEARGCVAYEAWNCVVVSKPPFSCANGAAFVLTSNALRPLGWTSADAAGLSILAGLVKLSEVTAGAVTHAIRMTLQTTQNGYIPPATHAAGSQPLGSAYPPMGLRLRMKASVDTSSYSAASQAIMAAMKRYGLIVADNGSSWYFQGDSNDGWGEQAPDGKDTLVGEVVNDFRSITGADFEAVYTGDPIATGL